MIKVAIAVSLPYSNDALFNPTSIQNRDDCLAPWRYLKSEGEKTNISFHTLDVFQKQGIVPNIVIFSDLPWKSTSDILGTWDEKVKKWAIILENEIILPHNWEMGRHSEYEKIFTWKDDIIDNVRYFKINYAINIPSNYSFEGQNKSKLCTMIAAHKKSNHPLENYSKRIEVIRWFEKHHPEEFDLFGFGWDRFESSSRIINIILNRISSLKELLAPRYKTYKGTVTTKKAAFSPYKFAFCFENAKNLNGYITEKIFDCFISGVVPIYSGAPNIQDYVPNNCFVDLQRFSTFDQLYSFLINVNNDDYACYAVNIQNFLKSNAALKFSAQQFVQTILNHTKEVLN